MLNEKSFDELLEMAVIESCQEEAYDIEEQAIKEAHDFSKEFESNMKNIFKRKASESDYDSQKITKGRRPKFKYLLVAVLLLILSSVTVLAYEPARKILKDYFYTIYNDHILIHPERYDGNEDEVIDKITVLKPSYVPDGYELIDESINETLGSVSLVWINAEGEVLAYDQTQLGNSQIIISSENTEPVDIMIGNNMGKIIMESDGMNSIFYEKDSFLYTVSGYLDKDVLLKIILSIK